MFAYPCANGLRLYQITTSKTGKQVNPADHQTTVATYSLASPADVRTAIDAALAAKAEWESLPFSDRAAIFLKAADLISTKYRYDLMAATMLGQGKNAWQAEIDAAAELCDFLRFSVAYAEQMYAQQPVHNSPGVWNRRDWLPRLVTTSRNLGMLPDSLGADNDKGDDTKPWVGGGEL